MKLRSLLKVLHAPKFANVKLFLGETLYIFEFGDMQQVIYLDNDIINLNEDYKIIKEFLDFDVSNFSIEFFDEYDITLKS